MDLTIHIILLFFPGIICKKIIEKLTNYDEPSSFKFMANSFVLGLISYVIYAFFISILNGILSIFTSFRIHVYFFTSLSENNIQYSFVEIGIVTIISIFVAIILSKSIKHDYFYRFFNWVGLTKKSADRDIWNLIFDKKVGDTLSRWVRIQDYDNNQVIIGKLNAVSHKFTDGEIFLSNVTVYIMDNMNAKYEIEEMYFRFTNKMKIIFIKNK